MTGADLSTLVSSSLINATELSYVEDAPGTRGILEKLGVLLRYSKRGSGDVRFGEEWIIAESLLELYRLQSPDRFTYQLELSRELPSCFIRRFTLIDPLNARLQSLVENRMAHFTVTLKINTPDRMEGSPAAGGFGELEATLTISSHHEGEENHKEETQRWKLTE